MLSTVADSLYWTSRYLERAEHTGRLIDVNLNLMLDQTLASDNQRWRRVMTSLGSSMPIETAPNDANKIIDRLAFDRENGSSIVMCIGNARENIRQVRQQISSEMWEQLNRLHLRVRDVAFSDLALPHDFFTGVRQGIHLFQGVTDSTMSHDQSWHFMQAGQNIERFHALGNLLDVHFREFLDPREKTMRARDYLEWVGLLKSCTAFEPYCRLYTADLRADRVAEFLILDSAFPHSMRFCIDRIQDALKAIADATDAAKSRRISRLAGRLRSLLGYSQIDEVMNSGLPAFLADLQRQCAQIHDAIHQAYVAYPVEAELAGPVPRAEWSMVYDGHQQ